MFYLLVGAGIFLILLAGYKIIRSEISKESVLLVALGILLIGLSSWQNFTFEGLGIKFSAAIKGEVTTPKPQEAEIVAEKPAPVATPTEVSSPPPPATTNTGEINGNTVMQVEFSAGGVTGRYFQSEPGEWIEENAATGNEIPFKEIERRKRGVRLYDASRAVTINLDLMKRRVMYGEGETPNLRQLYTITSVSTDPQ